MLRISDMLGEEGSSVMCGDDDKPQRSIRQSLNNRFEKELTAEHKIYVKDESCQLSQSFASWCDSFSSSLPSVNPKQALRTGAEKISQTLNTVRTTFGTLSQKLRKSTRRRQPLKNVDSPKTPVTPYSRSRNALGRTPTKLYSPFTIETPLGKENLRRRSSGKRVSPLKTSRVNLKKRIQGQKVNSSSSSSSTSSRKTTATKDGAAYSPEMKFSKDLLQTQIGIYEFQSTANKIIQNTSRG